MPTETDPLTYAELSAQLADLHTAQLDTLHQGIEHLSERNPDSTIAIQARHLHELLRAVHQAWECLSQRDQLLLIATDVQTFDSINSSTFGRLSIILESQLRHASRLVRSND